MNVAIIDDEPPAITLLSAYIQRTKFLELQITSTDPVPALNVFNLPNPPQLTFLDIDMPSMNGLDFARIIGSKTQIILTSSFREYGPEAFELAVTDYLLKPFSYERFLDAVKKVVALPSNQQSTEFFFVRTETRGKYARITIRDIIFILSDDHFIKIADQTGETIAMHKISDIQAWLPPSLFSRVHRSYIVNLSLVQAVDRGQVLLKTGQTIPIGRQYKDEFMASLRQLTINGRQ
jgi:two-component system LytT family response regulator